MKKEQVFSLADEHNKLLSDGQEMWQDLEAMGERIELIRNSLKKAGIKFDEIALIFGSYLDPQCGWEDEE